MTKKIFIGADTAVVGLLRFSDRNYVDLDELIRFHPMFGGTLQKIFALDSFGPWRMSRSF